MLKNNKKICRKLYNYYKKEFNKCTKNMLDMEPNFVIGLETLMLYLQYMQDTVALTKQLVVNQETINNMFLSLTLVLDNYINYKNCFLKQDIILNDINLTQEEKDKQVANLLKKSKLYWTLLWNNIAHYMEAWVTDECFMK